MSISNPARGTLSALDRSLLAAVTAGRPEFDPFVDRPFFRDQEATHSLANDGLIEEVNDSFVSDRSEPLRFPSPTDTAA